MRTLNGRKTYILATVFTAVALVGMWTGRIDGMTGLEMIMQAGLGATIRHALTRPEGDVDVR